MKPALFEVYLEFDVVDSLQYKDGLLLSKEYNLGGPIDAIRVNIDESSLDGEFE